MLLLFASLPATIPARTAVGSLLVTAAAVAVAVVYFPLEVVAAAGAVFCELDVEACCCWPRFPLTVPAAVVVVVVAVVVVLTVCEEKPCP